MMEMLAPLTLVTTLLAARMLILVEHAMTMTLVLRILVILRFYLETLV